ncbi:MAG: LexA family transcriptional regulator [Muribaculaceae bacterium]|nr:LexA family transcriptional regulator [Muribaculaceae bacterium]
MTNTETNVTIPDRIRFLMSRQHMSQQQFAQRVGINPSNMSKFLSGKLPITDGFINKIVVNMGVSKQWLVDGSDVPFPKVHAVPVANGPLPGMECGDKSARGIPVYDINVSAGCTELSRLFTADRIIGSLDLPGLGDDCCIVRVGGDSMWPVIKDGGYVAIRRINDMRHIFWGQIYVIIMEDYRLVKYVRRNMADADGMILHSANPDYDDMEISRSEVMGLYLVEMIINCDIRC